MTYTIVKDKDGNAFLKGDKKDMHCPFQAAIPVPNSVGGIGLMRIPCSSSCPHFSLDEEGKYVEITCGGQKLEIDVEIEEQKDTIRIIGQ